MGIDFEAPSWWTLCANMNEDATLDKKTKRLNTFSEVTAMNFLGLEMPGSWMGMCAVLIGCYLSHDG